MMNGTNSNSKGVVARIWKGSTGVELGVWRGGTSAQFAAKGLKKLYLVDAWSPEPYKNTTEWSWEEYVQRYQKLTGGFTEADFKAYYDRVYRDVVDKFVLNPEVVICRMTTNEFFSKRKSIINKLVDWVYVDASYSYQGVIDDLENCLKIIKPDVGQIFGDDFTNKPQVNKAVTDFAKKHNFDIDVFNKTQYELKK